MAAKTGDTVKIHFTGKVEDEGVFASSRDGDPVEFTVGAGRILPGIEDAVVGMEPGESKTVSVPPEKAYGGRLDELVQEVPRQDLPDGLEPKVGQRLTVHRPDGEPLGVSVAAVSDETVTLDANHPLAGRDLLFDLELVDIS